MIGWPQADDYPDAEPPEPGPPFLYRLTGWWYRWQACKLAAAAIGGPTMSGLPDKATMMWSFAVFFENYMWHGAEWTRNDFGPKFPVDLKVIRATPDMRVVS